jgi:hypothetical protein
MSPIILPKKYLNRSLSELFDIFKESSRNLSFKIDNRNIKSILSFVKNNNNYYDSIDIRKNIIYFLIKLCETDSIDNPLSIIDGGIPNGGIEFINKNTYDGLGIYHCHISFIDKGVLIWWLEFEDNNIQLKFCYKSPHPDDDYKSIITSIYNNMNSKI